MQNWLNKYLSYSLKKDCSTSLLISLGINELQLDIWCPKGFTIAPAGFCSAYVWILKFNVPFSEMCQVPPPGDCLIHRHIWNSLRLPGGPLGPVAPAHGVVREEGVVWHQDLRLYHYRVISSQALVPPINKWFWYWPIKITTMFYWHHPVCHHWTHLHWWQQSGPQASHNQAFHYSFEYTYIWWAKETPCIPACTMGH